MELKDGIIGVLIIALVSLGGGLGYVLLSEEPTTIDLSGVRTVLTTYQSGLPDDWSTAPNSSKIILTNQTGDSINITLGDILKQVEKGLDAEKYDIDTGIGITSIFDQQSGIPLTGIYLTDLLDKFNISYPGEITFISHNLDKYLDPMEEDITAVELLNKIENYEEDVIIVLAADKKWLQDSPLANEDEPWGNFTLASAGRIFQLKNLKEIKIDTYWTLEVYVDGVSKLTLEPSNFTDVSNQKVYNYSYDRSDFWNYNREVIGINLSLICDWAGMNDSVYFEVKVVAADGWAAPSGRSKDPGFNTTEIYEGLAFNSTYWDYVNESVANPDGVPLPAGINDGKPIILAYSQRILGEIDLGAGEPYPTNPVWPEQQEMRLAHGPLTCIVPGRTRDHFVSMIYRIDITITT